MACVAPYPKDQRVVRVDGDRTTTQSPLRRRDVAPGTNRGVWKDQEYKARCKTLNDDTISIVEKASPEYDLEAMEKTKRLEMHFDAVPGPTWHQEAVQNAGPGST